MCYPSSATEYGCINSLGIAFPGTCPSNKPKETVIEISLYTQKKDIARINSKAQEIFNILKSELNETEYLPIDASKFTQLIYFSGLTSEQSPFSELDSTIIKRAYNSDLSTKRWLQIGFVSAVGTPLILWAMNSQNPWVIATSLTVNVISNAISWISTGSNPDFKSDSANAKQDTLQRFSSCIEEMARELIDLKNLNPELAEKIAESLNLEEISKKIEHEAPANKKTLESLKPLSAARQYVLTSTLPEEAPLSIRTYAQLANLTQV